MVWNRRYRSPLVPLRYAALNDGIRYKRGGRRGEVKVHNNLWARKDGDDIQLKLWNTDIITFHPDGTKTLRVRGWHTELTHYWMRAAGYRITSLRPNKWTPAIWMLPQYSGLIEFFDEMRVDVHGQLIGEPKPMTMNVLNAKAKALRKQLLAIYKEHYLPTLRFLDLQGEEWYEGIMTWWTQGDLAWQHAAPFITHKDDVKYHVQLLGAVLKTKGGKDRKPSNVFKRYLDSIFESEVQHQQLYDVVPFNQGDSNA